MTFYMDGALLPMGYFREHKYSGGGLEGLESEDPSFGSQPPEDDSSGYLYDQLVFKADQLPNAEHSLEFTLDGPGSCFDYAIFTTDERTSEHVSSSQTTTTSAHNITAGEKSPSAAPAVVSSPADPPRGVLIAVPLVGGVMLAAVCAWCLARRRQRRQGEVIVSTGTRVEGAEDIQDKPKLKSEGYGYSSM
ncbi:hypothetical protein AURDEDRAFT_124006 [Auricularia subglabra TFB-10046 SS5]|nr:hypothetical protein AURDEDRAFT_124006 [Auricularia subglabra TFB-10046 SS5]